MEMRDKFIIKGLSGQRKLEGKIEVRGSKNAALPVMASSIIFQDSLTIENLPEIEDIFRMTEILENLGAKTFFKKAGSITINGTSVKSSPDLDEEISKKLRASIILTGPLLARFGKVSFPHPGGCVIGERPIDIFLDGFKKMGASVEEKNEKYFVKANKGKLKGAEIFFKIQSVTATETFLMAAVLAKGKTILKNVSLEPEVLSLGQFLLSCGAKIKGLGTTTLEIEGGSLLKSKGKKYQTIPDRLETGCFLILGALSAKNLVIENCRPDHVEALTEALSKSGVMMKIGKNKIEILESKNQKFKSLNIKTHEYPGFPTDLQAPMVVFLTQAVGESVVFETLFESRLNYTEDLKMMGADITMWDAHRVAIKGPTPLKAKELEGPDIRAGLAFVVAAIIAKGRSIINNIYYIDRGYERIEERLKKIGVDIKRVND